MEMEDVERFLLEQLTQAIDKEPSFASSSIFVECKKLKTLIEIKTPNTGAADAVIRKENIYYLSNIVAEWRLVLEKHNHYSPTAQIVLNGQLMDKLKKIRKDLEAHPQVHKLDKDSKHGKKKGDDDDHEEDHSHKSGVLSVQDEIKPRRGLENPYHVDMKKIWGIDDKSKAMERLLLRKETRNKEFQAIGIVGMAGVGKTTFCQVAFNNQQVKQHFMPRIWVEMSSKHPEGEEDYKKEVVKSFLRSLGFEDEVIDEIGDGGLRLLLLALRKQLEGKSYLVVLDDIWHLDEWFKEFCSSLAEEDNLYKERLSYGLPKGSGGCVIVTSRCESWGIDMVGEKNMKRLTPLEDEESIWQIFKNRILDKYWMEKDEEKIRGEIVARCGGLPLIAMMLGEIMIHNYKQGKWEGEGEGEEEIRKGPLVA
ncbi:probable disease resistance protein At5g45490 [Henckelia pumila]|uniref:probable disease resistance protein At5g45490 n=1 Tax=Henckelia pumila TaxID=405737 RepID=UPI003C6E6716